MSDAEIPSYQGQGWLRQAALQYLIRKNTNNLLLNMEEIFKPNQYAAVISLIRQEIIMRVRMSAHTAKSKSNVKIKLQENQKSL